MRKVQAGQPCWRPSDRGSTRHASASETSSAPPVSSRWRRLLLVSGIMAQAAMANGIPMGSLDRNTARQPSANGLHSTKRTSGELADGGCEPHHHAVDAEGLGKLRFAGEERADRAEHLRHQHRCGDALQDAADDQLERRDGEAAERVGGEEADHANEVEPPPAVEVAEAATGDQEHGVGGGITGDDELQFGGIGADGGMDRRQADVDDEEVDRRQQAADDQDDERQPAPRGR